MFDSPVSDPCLQAALLVKRFREDFRFFHNQTLLSGVSGEAGPREGLSSIEN